MDKQERQILLTRVNEAISLQVRLFDELSGIEEQTGKIYTNLDDLVQQYAADRPEGLGYTGMSSKGLDEFLEQLKEAE